jgi:tRNA (guanine37-N1)-methyltransferase
MIISINTLFPDLYTAFCKTSILGKAVEKGFISFQVRNMLDVCAPKERVDGPTFGHHAGMIIKPEVIERAVTTTEAAHGKSLRIFFSPRGKKLNQDLVRDISTQAQQYGHISLYAARYEGIDARAENVYADYLISLGDFVLMGGDLPAQITIEALVRYFPGVVGSQESVERDSFSGPFVDCPGYTAPVVWHNQEVPPVLRSGDHKKIETWSKETSAKETLLHHFDWLRTHTVPSEDRALVRGLIPHHYVALMHDEIMLPPDRIGTTSVTSLDIHDIARSATTYIFNGFFIVTPLIDQQKIVQTLLDFWREGDGISYNPDRHKALANTSIASSYTDVIEAIEDKEKKKPLVIATSARTYNTVKTITYHDQGLVWQQERPVLLLLGTGRGLAPQVLERADYIFAPLNSYADFNHLSVRSAAAIIFDRWLGVNVRRL